MLILVWADRLLKKKSYWSQKKFFPVNCALHFTFSSPAVTAPQNSSLSSLCGSYENCSLGRKQSKGKDKELIPDNYTNFEGIWYMKYKHFWLMGSTLIQFLMSEQAANLLCWLHLEGPRTSTGELQEFEQKYFSCASESHTRLLQTAYTAPRETRNSISKEITPNFSYTISFPSRNGIYEGTITFLLSLFCILYGIHNTSPVKDLLSFLSRLLLSDFCNSLQFSWDSTC